MGFGASDKQLTFNVDELNQLKEDTAKLCDSLEENRNSLKEGLEQLRKDWQTPAGAYFFESIDVDWESQIQKFIDTVTVFESILKDAVNELKAVEDKASRIATDF